MRGWQRSPASFRDPNGFVFTRDGLVYRQVNEAGAADFDWFVESGLYRELAGAGLLIGHEPVTLNIDDAPPAHLVLRPEAIPFISYPYEWCHSQLKAAALLTLELQQRALEKGGTLRDASAYNVQFRGGSPIFIDTLSFGRRLPGVPWAAYRQFCQHFLAPLAAMSYVDPSLGRLLSTHLDGLPLGFASRLLPGSTRLRPGLLFHIHLHAQGASRWAEHASQRPAITSRGVSDGALLGLVESLRSAVERLECRTSASGWSAYYGNTNYSPAAEAGKQDAVRTLLRRAANESKVRVAWDLGANVGVFSRIAAEFSSLVVAMDSDHSVVERHVRDCRARGETRILPLVQDIANPSPGIGWAGRERMSLAGRGPADLSLALALTHHLAIGSNVPLEDVAAFLALVSRRAIVEFVPREDSQVVRMLHQRDDMFPAYTRDGFEAAFGRVFRIVTVVPIPESRRTLYLLQAQ